MNISKILTVENSALQHWSSALPFTFKVGVIWARHAPRGKGAVPRILNRLSPPKHPFYIKTAHQAKLACWLGAADTYTGIAARGGVFEPMIIDVIRQELKPGQSFYDIGGNVGVMSLETSQIFEGKVDICCFEPQFELARHIAISAALNGFGSLSVFNCLLDEKEGEQELHIPAHSIHASMVAREAAIRVEKRAAYRLDDLVAEETIRPPDVIKIDVEGAEMRVFKGAQDMLQKYQPTIIFEADSNMARFGYDAKDLMAFLSECGHYRYFMIEADGVKARLTEISDFERLPQNMNILARPTAK